MSRASTSPGRPACRSRPCRSCSRASRPGGSPPRRRRRSGARPRSSATARTWPRGRCAPARRAPSGSSCPTSRTRSSGSRCAARRRRRGRRAMPSRSSTCRSTARSRRRWRRCAPGPADGFIYFSVEPPERRPGGERIVVIEAEPDGVPWVALDTAGGIDAAMAHLIELGHRRIAQLGSRVQYPTFQIRKARWRAALESVGVEPSEELWAGLGVRLRRRLPRRGDAARCRRSADRRLLRRRHPRGRRLPGGPRARPADPRGRLGGRVRRPAVRARAHAGADDHAAPTRRSSAPSPSARWRR